MTLLFLCQFYAWDFYRASNTSNTWSFTITSDSSGYSSQSTSSNNIPNSFEIISSPNPSTVNQTVTVTGSTTDPDGDALTYTYDWGDSTVETSTNTHVYTTAGTYTITCTASDGNDGTRSANTIQTVNSLPSKELSNTTKSTIETQYNITLEKPFYANDTDGDGVIDKFTDPNNKLTVVHSTTIQGNTSFLLSVNEDEIPEFFWDTRADTITPVTHNIGETTNTTTDIENGTVTVTITIEKTNWTYIEVDDVYPDVNITVKTIDGRTISSDKIWRKNNKIYVLDDPATEYQFIYEHYVSEPISEPPGETTLNITIYFVIIAALAVIIFICFIIYKKKY